jgi:tRNA A37 threonylcarbamoyladenosine dehydratase
MNAFIRVENLVGKDAYRKLKDASVAVFGVGGVGGYTVEALARCGVGRIALFDSDTVDESNINRQIIADYGTLGGDKVAVMKERLTKINPEIIVECNKVFYLPENASEFDLSKYDYVVDAVDTVSAKLEIIKRAKNLGVPVISCMGTGGKIEPEKLKVSVVEKTSGCPLARVMRRELKALNIKGVKVVYSEEQTAVAEDNSTLQKKADGKTAPPSMIFVPAVAGLMLAKEVVFDIINNGEKL